MASPESSPIRVPDAELDDLRCRLLATRWPDAVADDWQRGTAPSALKRLVAHWAEDFDWRVAEERLNSFDPIMVGSEGHRIHALRAGTRGATPLLLIHGWPDGVVRFLAALPLLAPRFDIVVPSVPGFGFSDHPHELVGPDVVARRFGEMMSTLGFERFAVHGADIGAHIAEQMAMQQPDRVSALHLGNVPSRQFRALPPAERDDAENEWFARAHIWDAAEGAYGSMQSTKPQTLAPALTDSPAGLASWILEKFHGWGDTSRDVFDRFTLDDLATNLTIYWATSTAGSAARYYFDAAHSRLEDGSVAPPTGFAMFPYDMLGAPRRTAERWYRVERWTEMPRGGHFGPWEEPQPWADEVTGFFDQLAL